MKLTTAVITHLHLRLNRGTAEQPRHQQAANHQVKPPLTQHVHDLHAGVAQRHKTFSPSLVVATRGFISLIGHVIQAQTQ